MSKTTVIKTPIGNISLHDNGLDYCHTLHFRSNHLAGSKSFASYKTDFEIVNGTSIIGNVTCEEFPRINSITFMIDDFNHIILDVYDNNIDKSYYEKKVTKENNKIEKYANRKQAKINTPEFYETDLIPNKKKFYIYEHYIKSNNNIFYVGKGFGDRYRKIERNNACNRVWKNNECDVRIIKDNMNEREALDFEHERIKELSKKGFILTNILD